MHAWKAEFQKIAGLDEVWKQKAQHRLKEQTRPEGSLGILENFLERLVAIQKKERLEIGAKRILIFAADHGVAAEGVSLYPSQVTKAMVLNFLNGGATINALARHIHAEVQVIDVGVNADFGEDPRPVHAKVGYGTRNMTQEAAMTPGELDQAVAVGWNLVQQAKREGVTLLGLGEMGIANTTAASAVISALTRLPVDSVTGRGTGLGEAALQHKIEVIQRAHERHRNFFRDPLQILQRLGGYEIAAMTGAILAAARLGVPLVVDGWIVSASALVAIHLNPKTSDYLFFAHQSGEHGHRLLLDLLEVNPILNLSLRLGEASGAALAMGILEAAMRVYNEVATFAEAGVANRER